jgi:hypothetical protein
MNAVLFHTEVDFNEFARKLASFQDYRHRLWAYSTSLKQAAISVESLRGEESLFIHFRSVLYLRLPTTWQGIALKPDSPLKCREILTNLYTGETPTTPLELMIRELTADSDMPQQGPPHRLPKPYLFSAEAGKLIIHIICEQASIRTQLSSDFN